MTCPTCGGSGSVMRNELVDACPACTRRAEAEWLGHVPAWRTVWIFGRPIEFFQSAPDIADELRRAADEIEGISCVQSGSKIETDLLLSNQ